MNQKSFVLLLRQSLTLQSASADIVNFQLQVLKYCHVHKVPELRMEEWGLVRLHFDEFLSKSLAQ